MYPINLHHKTERGYAVASDEAEHAALSDAGYEPKLEKPTDDADELAAVRAKLDAAGVKYHHKAVLDKLKALLPA